MAVDLEGEVSLGEVLDESAFFVANDDRDIDQAGVDRDGARGGWRRGRGLGFLLRMNRLQEETWEKSKRKGDERARLD